ncbi:MAG TPA: hypothetical protein VFB12_31610 [Ktedonobacteraceae bacterium]|nr:hypothetical protein [Ktedonobacteraceae bacterium]
MALPPSVALVRSIDLKNLCRDGYTCKHDGCAGETGMDEANVIDEVGVYVWIGKSIVPGKMPRALAP